MVRALFFVFGIGSLLLFASAAAGQPVACTRYENGRTFILPGCRGPGIPFGGIIVDGSTAGPINPFTGHSLAASAVTMSWSQWVPTVLVPLVPDPNDASLPTIVEAPFTVVLTASFSQPRTYGSRISRIRVTNRDLIEEFKEQFGVSGRRARLVIRRDIWDLEGAEAQLYMILDGVDFLVEDFLEPLPLSLPEGFYGRASGHTLNRRTGAVSSLHIQEVSAMALGDLAVDGFTMGLFSLDGGRFRALAPVQNAALLCKRFTSKVTGGMQVSELPLDSPMLVTGILRIGQERVLSP